MKGKSCTLGSRSEGTHQDHPQTQVPRPFPGGPVPTGRKTTDLLLHRYLNGLESKEDLSVTCPKASAAVKTPSLVVVQETNSRPQHPFPLTVGTRPQPPNLMGTESVFYLWPEDHEQSWGPFPCRWATAQEEVIIHLG